MLENKCFIIWTFLVLFIVINIQAGQPKWSENCKGDLIYSLSTDSWEECGLLCTRDYQRVESVLWATNCTWWTWYDPSNRNYANICRLFEYDVLHEESGQAISGQSGCYSLSTC